MKNKKPNIVELPMKQNEYKVLIHVEKILPMHVTASNQQDAADFAMEEYGNGNFDSEDCACHVDESETFSIKSIEKLK
jgi:hypothetical protein|tara:strand:- start:1047 stop:1280 length:234 start_codon:yes stop_codon:yes gene_type:complete